MKWRAGVFTLGIMLLATVAMASSAMEALKGPVNEMMDILRDPQFKAAEQKSAQRDKMWTLVNRIFDFHEIARRTLSANWKSFTDRQRAEFTGVFTELLGNTYLDRVQGEYQDEQVVFLDEQSLSAERAVVNTKIVRKTSEMPVSYALYLREGRWMVYDVKIEDAVSLVSNYRAQFERILVNSSPDKLIDQVRERAAKQKEETAGK
jgi:phospholipid transport system substrate-binding protein